MVKTILYLVALMAASVLAETNVETQAQRSLIDRQAHKARDTGDQPGKSALPGMLSESSDLDKKPSKNVVSGLVDEEARSIILDLSKKNEALSKEILDLKDQVRKLTHSLAKEKAQVDELMFQRKQAEVRSVGLGLSKTSSLSKPIRLMDVNSDLNVAVMSAGWAEGLKNGMIFSIQKRGKPVARLRALDVREHLTGAEILEFKKGEYPSPGDRAIPVVTGEH